MQIRQLQDILLQLNCTCALPRAGGAPAPAPAPPAAPKPKAKAKSKGSVRHKTDKQGNPIAVWDLKKCRSSQLQEPFPVVDRQETRKAMEKEIISKDCLGHQRLKPQCLRAQAGAFAKITAQLADYSAAKDALSELQSAKTELEQAWKASLASLVKPCISQNLPGAEGPCERCRRGHVG